MFEGKLPPLLNSYGGGPVGPFKIQLQTTESEQREKKEARRNKYKLVESSDTSGIYFMRVGKSQVANVYED